MKPEEALEKIQEITKNTPADPLSQRSATKEQEDELEGRIKSLDGRGLSDAQRAELDSVKKTLAGRFRKGMTLAELAKLQAALQKIEDAISLGSSSIGGATFYDPRNNTGQDFPGITRL